MAENPTQTATSIPEPQPSLVALLAPYKLLVGALIVLVIAANGLNLVIPKIISSAIDSYANGTLAMSSTVWEFALAAFLIFVLTYLQSLAQTYASERVARDLRTKLSAKISHRSFAQIEEETPSKLLTNLTSDIDGIKLFVSMAVVSIISSVFLIIGASVLMFRINWKLALAVLAILPFIGVVFLVVFSRVRPLFKRTQEIIDRLNKTINESILGAALIRVVNSNAIESGKFFERNGEARQNGMKILGVFSNVIPIISIIANLALLIILVLGGHFVILGSMTLGNFTAFNSYVGILIFPIIILGFISNVISRAQASYGRVHHMLNAPDAPETGTLEPRLRGDIEVRDATILYGEKYALKDVSIRFKAGTKNAIIGPTAAGKTQLLYILIGLLAPTKGEVLYDERLIGEYKSEALHNQVGIVFQDSSIFNISLRENIAFSATVTDEALKKAINTAELEDFIEALPEKLDTVVSERGTSLSGGQKQRIMLARALALDPKVLLLDDFTARVDAQTERKILANIAKNYPDLTLVSVTQKIAAVEAYEQIVLLMEGEVLGSGTHEHLSETSPEYMQIVESQRSTNTYEGGEH